MERKLCPNDISLFSGNDTFTQLSLHYLGIFSALYAKPHGYICLVICIFGLVTNFVHVIVLTRRSLRKSAVNCIMTVVAFCDMGTMFTYLVYNLHYVLGYSFSTKSCSNKYSYGWNVFLYIHVIGSILLHSTTLWLAVAMAFLRRITLQSNSFNSAWQKAELARKICVIIFIFTFISIIPTILVHNIVKTNLWYPKNEGIECINDYGGDKNISFPEYTIDFPEFVLKDNCRIFKGNLWLSGILNKVIPSLLLFFLSFSLMAKLKTAQEKRRKLLENGHKISSDNTVKRKYTDKTTAMLLAILIVFLMTEVPQGVVMIITAIYTNDGFNVLYRNLADILDLLSLINSSVNFIMYCVMSSRYRATFLQVVLNHKVQKFLANNNGVTTFFLTKEYIPSTSNGNQLLKMKNTTLGDNLNVESKYLDKKRSIISNSNKNIKSKGIKNINKSQYREMKKIKSPNGEENYIVHEDKYEDYIEVSDTYSILDDKKNEDSISKMEGDIEI
uniref:G_PROTEIN_RECEP_F1_2 domain-containing protein n=1 Tax=Strongyloides papillosus TaxID=174720 RepID=A0A0N5BDH2_STREA